MLNTHSMLYAPSELHLRHVRVDLQNSYAELAMRAQGFDVPALEYLLWDSLLARLLSRSGKPFLVEKSPSNSRIWQRLSECWPDARYLILRRNPAAIAASIMARGHDELRATAVIRESMDDLDAAANHLSNAHLATYEDLCTSPESCCRDICGFLGVDYEQEMLDYGRHDHGPFVYGIGDWSERIQSGQLQPLITPPEPISLQMRELCDRWGYRT